MFSFTLFPTFLPAFWLTENGIINLNKFNVDFVRRDSSIFVNCYNTEQQQIVCAQIFLDWYPRQSWSHGYLPVLKSFAVWYLAVALFTMKCWPKRPVIIVSTISLPLRFNRSISECVNDSRKQLKGSSAEISTLLNSILSKEASRQVATPTGLYDFTSLTLRINFDILDGI